MYIMTNLFVKAANEWYDPNMCSVLPGRVNVISQEDDRHTCRILCLPWNRPKKSKEQSFFFMYFSLFSYTSCSKAKNFKGAL